MLVFRKPTNKLIQLQKMVLKLADVNLFNWMKMTTNLQIKEDLQ